MELSSSPSPVLPKRVSPLADSDQLSPGFHRLGRYQVTGRLGQGGMGVVYAAEDTLLKRQVALKLLPREVSTNPEALQRFLREAQAAARLSHPNVVAVFDCGEAEGSHYIVLELITGGNAQEFMRSAGPFHWTEATSILRDVCRGVAAAHRAGLLHRDIKPANILRSTEGVVKLGDFGLVKALDRQESEDTALGAVLGTPHYMSPEQGRGADVDERCDIYALGATYFALLTGRPPYLAENALQILFAHCSKPIPDPRTLVAGIPEPCVAIIRKAMAKSRTQRYASAGELLAELEQVLTQQPSGSAAGAAPLPPFVWSKDALAANTSPVSFAAAYPGELTEQTSAPRRRRWRLDGRSLFRFVLLGLLLAAIVVALTTGRHEPEPTAPPAKSVTPRSQQDDWPTLTAAAYRAIQSHSAADMQAVLARIKGFQQRTADARPEQQQSVRQLLAMLEKSLAFRESITEQGLIVRLDGRVSSVAPSPEGRWVAVGQSSGSTGAVVFDGYTGEKRASLWPRGKGGLGAVQALAFAHDSATLAAAFADSKVVRLRQFPGGRETALSTPTGVSSTLSLAFAPTARVLVMGFDPVGEGRGKPYLKAVNIDTSREPFLFKAEHTAKIGAVAFCMAGQMVATGSHDRRIVLWNTETGRIWRELHTGLTIEALAGSLQGRILAVAGMDKGRSLLQFWDYDDSKLLAVRPNPEGLCCCVALHRTGALLASGSGTTVLLWRPETQEILATLPGHNALVTSLAFLGDGGILVTGSDDQTIRFWDVTRCLPSRPGP